LKSVDICLDIITYFLSSRPLKTVTIRAVSGSLYNLRGWYVDLFSSADPLAPPTAAACRYCRNNCRCR